MPPPSPARWSGSEVLLTLLSHQCVAARLSVSRLGSRGRSQAAMPLATAGWLTESAAQRQTTTGNRVDVLVPIGDHYSHRARFIG